MSEEQPKQILSDAEESAQYLKVPTNKPRHLISVDEFIGRIIRVTRLIQLKIDTPDDTYPMVTLVVRNPEHLVGEPAAYQTYKGEGPSVGHALREVLDKLNVEYPLGDEYDEPLPPAA